jgi:glycosyltransferase involved in cell wall biosynthesis
MTSSPAGATTSGSPAAVEVLRQQAPSDRPAPVTVVILLYNNGRFVRPCLDSVRDQTLGDLDLIVVDDCSTDRSADVVAAWMDDEAGRFNHCQLLRHRVHGGLSQTRNTAFFHAASPHVFVLDADRVIYPRCLESLLAALENCDASFAYCYLERFGDARDLANLDPWGAVPLTVRNSIDAMVLLRRTVWQQVGGYCCGMRPGGEDFDLWFKVARLKGWGILVPEILARYRVRDTSTLQTVTSPNAEVIWNHLRSTYPEFFTNGSEYAVPSDL